MFKLLVLKQALSKMPTTKDGNSFSMKNVPNHTLRISSIIHIFLAVLPLTQSVESTRCNMRDMPLYVFRDSRMSKKVVLVPAIKEAYCLLQGLSLLMSVKCSHAY